MIVYTDLFFVVSTTSVGAQKKKDDDCLYGRTDFNVRNERTLTFVTYSSVSCRLIKLVAGAGTDAALPSRRVCLSDRVGISDSITGTCGMWSDKSLASDSDAACR